MKILKTTLSTPSRVVFFICGCSLVLIISGLTLKNYHDENYATLAEMLYTIGYALFVTTSVTFILNKSYKDQIEKFLLLVSSSRRIGIKMIYENRMKALPEIFQETHRAENYIDILAIAGTDFFKTSRDHVMKKIGSMAYNDSNVKIRILLQHPGSRSAILRAMIEERLDPKHDDISDFDYTNSKLWKNIFISLEELQFLIQKLSSRDIKNFEIEVRLFEVAPMLLYYSVNKRTFVEQYHNGTISSDSSTFLRDCIGKLVPVIEYYKGSNNSRIYAAHFDSIWIQSEKWSVASGYPKKLNEMLSKSWLSIFNAYNTLLSGYLLPGVEETHLLNGVAHNGSIDSNFIKLN